MVEKIKQIKDKLLEQLEQELMTKGADRIDPQMVDAVKDLAEAEKSCWEAEYYRSVSEAMENQGYMPEDGMGYGSRGGRMGYRDSMGRYARRGYSMGYHEELDGLRQKMQTASPEEREKMQRELRQMLNM